jgi:arylsulfatase A-like enzyme
MPPQHSCNKTHDAWLRGTSLPSRTSALPHVALMMADDLGFDLGAFGHPLASTPAIDRLAREGSRFEMHQAGYSCSPSRAGMLTGRNPAFYQTAGRRTYRDQGLPTLTRVLAGAGYAVGHFGKWHIGGSNPNVFGSALGNSYGMHVVVSDRQPLECVARASRKGRFRVSHILQEFVAADKFLQVMHNRRATYMNVWAHIPHDPVFSCDGSNKPAFTGPWHEGYNASWQPPNPSWFGPYYTARVRVATSKLGIDAEKALAMYTSAVSRLDASVGHLLGTFDELGLQNRSIAVFTSDHGPGFPTLAGDSPFLFGASPWLRSGKLSPYNGGNVVPFVLRWPGRVTAGRAVGLEARLSGLDFLPTLLHALGISDASIPAATAGDGQNMLRVWTGRSNGSHMARALFWAPMGHNYTALTLNFAREGPFVIIKSHWKLLVYRDNASSGFYRHIWRSPPWRHMELAALGADGVSEPAVLGETGVHAELYNLRDDPGETVNRAIERPALLGLLGAHLSEWIRSLPWPRGAEPLQVDSVREIATGTAAPLPEWNGPWPRRPVPECAYKSVKKTTRRSGQAH